MTNRNFAYAVCLLLTAAAPARAQEIVFGVEVPKPPVTMVAFKLAPARQPLGLMTEMLKKLSIEARFAPLSGASDQQGVFESGRLTAVLEAGDGSARLFPSLNSLKSMSVGELSETSAAATQLFARPEFIPPDATTYRIFPRGDLKMSRVASDQSAPVAELGAGYLSYYMAQRFVGEYPVEGPGSRAMVAVGGSGMVRGMTRIWRAVQKPITAATIDPLLIREQILARIRRLTSDPTFLLTVPEIQIVYYDDNVSLLQPMVRFVVMMGPASQRNPALLTGYIPLIDGLKSLPDSLDPSNPGGLQPTGTPLGPLGATQVSVTPGLVAKKIDNDLVLKDAGASRRVVRVGRFIATFADAAAAEEWEVSSRDLGNALTGNSTTFQTLAEEPLTSMLALTSVADVVNGLASHVSPNPSIGKVDLALFEAHGEPWKLYGYDTWDAPVDVAQLPLPTAGNQSGNSVAADWILHSCSVIPSDFDMPALNKASTSASVIAGVTAVPAQEAQPARTWDEPWRKLLGPVRSIVGYRTRMFVDDGAPAAYARKLAANARVSSWFNEVASLNRYARSVMGRASAIFICGHADDVLSDEVKSGTDPVCVENWWMADCSGRACPKTTEKDLAR